MSTTEIVEKFSVVEAALAEFIIQTSRSFNQLHREMREFKDEMREFKDEMREFKNEMRGFKNEMSDFKDEMREFKDEMSDFKDEMSDFKNESQRATKEMNKQWGALANKMGTLVEDIIAPAVRPVMKSFFKEEINYRAVNVNKKDTARDLRGEFDVIATSKSYVFLVETKSSPQKQHLQEFTEKKIPRFRALFPEFASLELIPVFSSLRFEDEFLEWATEARVYLMAYREWDYMDILNFDALHPTSLA